MASGLELGDDDRARRLGALRSPSRQDTLFGLYAPSGAPRGQAATPFGAPEGVRADREAPVRRGETAGTV